MCVQGVPVTGAHPVLSPHLPDAQVPLNSDSQPCYAPEGLQLASRTLSFPRPQPSATATANHPPAVQRSSRSLVPRMEGSIQLSTDASLCSPEVRQPVSAHSNATAGAAASSSAAAEFGLDDMLSALAAASNALPGGGEGEELEQGPAKRPRHRPPPPPTNTFKNAGGKPPLWSAPKKPRHPSPIPAQADHRAAPGVRSTTTTASPREAHFTTPGLGQLSPRVARHPLVNPGASWPHGTLNPALSAFGSVLEPQVGGAGGGGHVRAAQHKSAKVKYVRDAEWFGLDPFMDVGCSPTSIAGCTDNPKPNPKP